MTQTNAQRGVTGTAESKISAPHVAAKLPSKQPYSFTTSQFAPKLQAAPQTAKLDATPKASPKKKMPLFVPREQNWDEEPLPINSNNIYQLLTAPVNKPLDELVKDPAMPILAFTGTLLQEIRYITHRLSNSEYAVFLALRRIDENHPHFLAYDFFMPEQKASGGGVSLDPKDCQRHFDGLKQHSYYREHGLHRHLCHLHSHASMQVFWSGTDDTQQLSRDDLGFMDDFRFYCVVNAKDEIKCSFVFYKPVLARVDAAVAVSFSGQEHAEQLTRKRRQELDDMIESTLSGYSLGVQHVSEFGAAAGQTEGAAKGVSGYFKGGGNKFGSVQGNGWGGKEPAVGASRASWNVSGNARRSVGRDDYEEYWDSYYGGNGAEYGWNDAALYSGSRYGKNMDDSENQPITLGWFAFLDDYQGQSKVSDVMLQAFLYSANVDRRYAKRGRKILSWVMDQVLGVLQAESFDEMRSLVIDPDEILGDVIGEYVRELSPALQNSNAAGEDWEDKMYLSEDTCQAIRAGNKDKIIEAVINDLCESLSDALQP